MSDWVNEPLIKDTLNKDIYLCVKDTFSVPTYIYIYIHIIIIMGFALFAPRGKKLQKDESWDLHFFVPKGKSRKRMNRGICIFCAKGQKPQKDESWDLHFLRQREKAAKG